MSKRIYSEFNGKVAIVTGAARGIGKSISDALAEEGACVIALDKNFNDGSRAYSEGLTPGLVIPQRLDVSDQTACFECFEQIFNDFGEVHYLAHAAGVLNMGGVLTSCSTEWEESFRINLMGSFNILSEGARRMQIQKKGAIVLIGSNASSTPRKNMGSYAASKAAATQMAKCLALEVAEQGVRCNVLAPGSTDTTMQRQLWQNEEDKQGVINGDSKNYRLGIPLKKIATPEQIAKVAIFLLSDQSSHMTMEVVRVDGGATLGSY